MAYYDDSYRSKMQREQKSKYYTPSSKIKQWHVVSVDVQFNENDLALTFPLQFERERLVQTLQFLCANTPQVGDGLPSLLELTSADRLRQTEDGRQCLHLSRKEYAIVTLALLPLYIEPSSKNIKRECGYKTTAWHPILMRCAMTQGDDAQVNKWRQWAFVRSLAALTNATVSGAPMLEYDGGVNPASNRHFVVYTLLPRVLDIIFRFFGKSPTRFLHMLSTTTVIYDAVAAFLMPARLEYINHRLIDEVLNIVSMDDAFACRNDNLVTEIRKLANWVSTLDEHSRMRIKVDPADTRCDVNFGMLHSTLYFAACEPHVDLHVAMAMLCSLAVSKRNNKSLYLFLDSIPTPCQFNRRAQDLFNRATQGWPTADHSKVVKEVLHDVITTNRYDAVLGMSGEPVKLKKPHFPLRNMRAEYATRTYESYCALVKEDEEPIVEDKVVVRTPLQALYLYVSSFDRHLSVPVVEEMDAWDLLSGRLLCGDHLLPLTNSGHYLDRSFFHL